MNIVVNSLVRISITILVVTPISPGITAQTIRDMIPSLKSTYNIQGESASGTCFMLKDDGNQYFFTAAHLFRKSRKAGDVVIVRIVENNQACDFQATIFPHPNRNVDVAMFTLDRWIDQGDGLDTTLTRVESFQEELLFYGFPLRNMGTEVRGIKYPLVKRATVSGVVKYLGVDVLVLDGHNNHGFSGGPVVKYNDEKKKAFVVAIVSGYFFERRKLKSTGEKKDILFDENSGIIISYPTKYMAEILHKYKQRRQF